MTDWVTYLEGFHSRSPGLVEAVLARCVAGDLTPNRWLARAVSPGVSPPSTNTDATKTAVRTAVNASTRGNESVISALDATASYPRVAKAS